MSPPSPSSALDVEHADQREQAPRGVEIDLDLAVETFDQHLRRLVVQREARHVDGLDLLRGRRAARLIIAVADRDIVAARPAKAPEAEDYRFEQSHVRASDIAHTTPLFDTQRPPVGAGMTESAP